MEETIGEKIDRQNLIKKLEDPRFYQRFMLTFGSLPWICLSIGLLLGCIIGWFSSYILMR